MLSLSTFIAVLIAFLLLTAGVLAWTARLFGSINGRLRVGLSAALVIAVVNIVFTLLELLLGTAWPDAVIVSSFILLLFHFFVIFLVVSRSFRLSVGRTFGPFLAFMLLGMAEFAFALWVMKPFMVEAFMTPMEGMRPTLAPGDRFIVNKLLRPHRWDVVAYWTKDLDQRVIFVKRLVGLPGEKLRFQQGLLYVNDEAQVAPAVVTGQYHASLPFIAPDRMRYKEGETIVLGPNEFFFIGDVVETSNDSRLSGPSDRSALIGIVDVRYWPLSRLKILR